ncbi:MAG: hypothetical protein SGPRY_010865 [Prymnesium sp.]
MLKRAEGRGAARRGARRRELRSEEEQELSEAFHLFDSEGTGRIDYHELKVAMRSLGFNVKKAEVLQLMEQYDLTRPLPPSLHSHVTVPPLSPPPTTPPSAARTGQVTFSDFLEIMTDKISARTPEEELMQAFELFDEVGEGWVG